MKYLEIADSDGRPTVVATAMIVAVTQGPFKESYDKQQYRSSIILTLGGHRIESMTNFETVRKGWLAYLQNQT